MEVEVESVQGLWVHGRPFYFVRPKEKLLNHKKTGEALAQTGPSFWDVFSHSTAKRVRVLCYRAAGGAARQSDPKSVPLKVPPIPQRGFSATPPPPPPCYLPFARKPAREKRGGAWQAAIGVTSKRCVDCRACKGEGVAAKKERGAHVLRVIGRAFVLLAALHLTAC